MINNPNLFFPYNMNYNPNNSMIPTNVTLPLNPQPFSQDNFTLNPNETINDLVFGVNQSTPMNDNVPLHTGSVSNQQGDNDLDSLVNNLLPNNNNSYPFLYQSLFMPYNTTGTYTETNNSFSAPNINTGNTLTYQNIELNIPDENQLLPNMFVLNADTSNQTKFLVVPSIVYDKYFQPVIQQVKEDYYMKRVDKTVDLEINHTFDVAQEAPKGDCELISNFIAELSKVNCGGPISVNSSNNEITLPVINEDGCPEISNECSSTAQTISTVEKSVSSGNNYKKTNNKKGIKKKRKYIKSGLYRKDKSGNFLFSSSDRSRLATLIEKQQVNVGSTGSSSNVQDSTEENKPTDDCIVMDDIDSVVPTVEEVCMSEEDKQGFELYCKEQTLQKDAPNNLTILLEQWKALPNVEKERYIRPKIDNAVALEDDSMKNMDAISVADNGNNGKYSRVKKPLNAYNIYCKIHFPDFQCMYPDLPTNQISKLIGEKWKSLTNEEKQPYIEKSKNSQPVVKKPLNSYNLYCKQNFDLFKKKYPDLSIHLLSKKVADSWKNLSEEEKRVYYDDAMRQRQENLLQVQQTLQK
ncbi:hypothetical protein ABK040_005319 [Willaertia magna]